MSLEFELDPKQLEIEAERARELWETVYRHQVPLPLLARVRFTRVHRDRFAETDFGSPFAVFTKGLRSNAIEDDKTLWSKLQQKIADFDNEINELRKNSGNALVIKVRYLQPFGMPKLCVQTKDGKKLKKGINSRELESLGARGAAMPLRRAIEIEGELKICEKQILKALNSTPKLLDQLLDVAVRRGRVGGGPLGLTDTIFNQINKLAVSNASYTTAGHWCPLMHNCFEHLRTATSLTSSAVTGHLLTMNSLYNYTNTRKDQRYRKRGAMYLRALNTGPMALPRLEWFKSMLKKSFKRPIFYSVVTRTIYSKGKGRMTLLKTVPVQTLSGTLNPQAVAYAGLTQMWDIYRWVDKRAEEIKAINIKQLSLFRPILVSREETASKIQNWADFYRDVESQKLAILTR